MPDPEWFTSMAEAQARLSRLVDQWRVLANYAANTLKPYNAALATATERSWRKFVQWRSNIDIDSRNWLDQLEQWTSLANQYQERMSLAVQDGVPPPIPDIRQDPIGKTKRKLDQLGDAAGKLGGELGSAAGLLVLVIGLGWLVSRDHR